MRRRTWRLPSIASHTRSRSDPFWLLPQAVGRDKVFGCSLGQPYSSPSCERKPFPGVLLPLELTQCARKRGSLRPCSHSWRASPRRRSLSPQRFPCSQTSEPHGLSRTAGEEIPGLPRPVQKSPARDPEIGRAAIRTERGTCLGVWVPCQARPRLSPCLSEERLPSLLSSVRSNRSPRSSTPRLSLVVCPPLPAVLPVDGPMLSPIARASTSRSVQTTIRQGQRSTSSSACGSNPSPFSRPSRTITPKEACSLRTPEPVPTSSARASVTTLPELRPAGRRPGRSRSASGIGREADELGGLGCGPARVGGLQRGVTPARCSRAVRRPRRGGLDPVADPGARHPGRRPDEIGRGHAHGRVPGAGRIAGQGGRARRHEAQVRRHRCETARRGVGPRERGIVRLHRLGRHQGGSKVGLSRPVLGQRCARPARSSARSRD